MLIKSDPKFAKYATSLITFYRQNPVVAANHLLRRDGEPLTLAPVQEIVLQEWWEGKFCLLTASRGAGKTFIAAVYCALQCMLYPGTKIGIFAPAFRQSKLIFKEFTRLFNESPLLQECIDKEPTEGNDQCICRFKPIAGRNTAPSEIKALPVGSDGGKIRGERFRKVILDEIPHLPETIFRSSIQPMMSTAVNPMIRVKQMEDLRKKFGDDIPEDLITSDNGYIGITSGYYQFNYWWNEIESFFNQMQQGSKNYSLRFIPYTELPDGFYDADLVNDAKINAPRHMFLTEWMAEWIADSEGAFPMSLLVSARDEKVIPKHSKDPNTDKNKTYILGVDVARERDSTAIVVVELGYPSKVVFISELEETPFPKQADHLFNLIERFNPVAIYMDQFGGGGTLRDHLADPETVGWPKSHKVISKDENVNHGGKRILTLCNFNPEFIEDANNNTKTLLEQRAIKLPAATNPIEGYRKGNVKGQAKEIDLVQELINQTASVVVTQTPTGKLHYDLPKNSGSSKVKKKDLYSAFILACKCVYDLEWKPKADKILVERGVIKEVQAVKPPSILTPNMPSGIIPARYAGTESGGNSKILIPSGGVIITRNVRNKK